MVNPYSTNTVKMWSPDWSIFKCRKRFSTLICQFLFANIVKIWSTKWSILTCLICIVKIWFTKSSILTCLILWRSSPPRGQFLLVQYVLWRSGSPSVQFLLVKYCEDLVHQVVNDDFSHPQGPVDVSHLKEEMMTNHLLFFKHIFKNHLNLRYLTIGNKDETDL